MTTFPKRRWLVGFTLESSETPQDMRPCWTFRSAQRLAQRWNRSNYSPGLFEVFGPLGKGED